MLSKLEDRPIFKNLAIFFSSVVLDLGRNFKWSYLPPLMVYFAAGISGLTAIVGTFFIKDYLGLSAAFLAGLGFWAGLPWALKMPVGHLVDLIWHRKYLLVILGAILLCSSLLIMYALILHTEMMSKIMSVEAWYILAALLSPTGYMLQDVVADAMTVEAVPSLDEDGQPFADDVEKAMHVTMQTLGRVAIFVGGISVSAINIIIFDGVEALTEAEKTIVYSQVYLWALFVPVISVSGVVLGSLLLRRQAANLRRLGFDREKIEQILYRPEVETTPNWWIFGGSAAFVIMTLSIGLAEVPYAQEMTFTVSLAIILFLMSRLIRELPENQGRMLVGTAIIIFMYRVTPNVGAGLTWFEIDILGFDEQFLSVLTFLSYALTLVGLILLRPVIVKYSIARIMVLLSLASVILNAPNIALYYGVQDWTAALTNGVVDARFIAIFDTAIESPLGQISMIPMLAWIAKNAPLHLKATFFAVMASFTNLALSGNSLFTKYMNEIFVVTREVRDRVSQEVTIPADYSELGWLLWAVAGIVLVLPVATVFLVQHTRLRTSQ